MTATTRRPHRSMLDRRIPAARPEDGREATAASVVAPRVLESIAVVGAGLLLSPHSLAPFMVVATAMLFALNVDHPRSHLPGRPTRGLHQACGRMAFVGILAGSLWPAHLEYVVTFSVTAVATVVGLRLAATGVQRARWRRGLGLTPTVIVGAGPVGQAIARTLLRRPEYGLRPMGFVDEVEAHESLPVPILGPPGELDEILRVSRARCAILAFGRSKEDGLIDILRAVDVPAVRFFVLPRFFELGLTAPNAAADVRGFPLIPVRSGPRRWPLKRVFDVVVGSLLLVATAPLLAACALAVRASGPGPVIFRQVRVGLGGQHFQMLKFRTMTPAADEDTRWGTDESRITPVGRILRPSHLDELPQLFNVLRGDMSLVGPRPERPGHVAEFGEVIRGYRDRHRLPVGLTGLAQVNGLWGDTSLEDRARLDNRYIEHWTLGRDLAILLRTLPTLLGRRDGSEPETAGLIASVTPMTRVPGAIDGRHGTE